MSKHSLVSRAFAYAFPLAAPIGLSFVALGLALGMYAISQGLPLWMPILMASLIYAGAMEFITVGLLLSPFDPLGVLILTLMVNGRHIFYGVSILDRYQHLGWKRLPLIGGLVDESFAINVSVSLPDDVDEGWFYLHVTWLLYLSWIFGVLMGSLLATALAGCNMHGIEFVLAALFISIFVDMLRSNRTNTRFQFGAMGFLVSLVALVFLGPKSFALPAIFVMVAYCFIAYKWGGVHID